MCSTSLSSFTFLAFLIIFASCKSRPELKDEDKIFHAGPVNSGFSTSYFGLYKGDKYQFCDGVGADGGCYTGNYTLSGDTISLQDMKEHKGIPSNRLLIRRYAGLDSSYWMAKYPKYKGEWQNLKRSDSLRGASGDVLYLNADGTFAADKEHYFLIRMDKLKGS